ncbi:hypothetical protein GCM10010415_37120 [Streptomyces atrovirens]|uniref:Uncharacterized protein n=1 Tax=Streptomyces atrovirens TaxID=285556 RepID=A0ABW0DPH0_9ACTN
MALSRVAAEFAAEINQHDWSDAPYRADRAGHKRAVDRTNSPQLEPQQIEVLKMNVAWVTGQVLAFNDPNFNEHEFFEACGLNPRTTRGQLSGWVTNGLRFEDAPDGSRRYQIPGTYEYEGTVPATSS